MSTEFKRKNFWLIIEELVPLKRKETKVQWIARVFGIKNKSHFYRSRDANREPTIQHLLAVAVILGDRWVMSILRECYGRPGMDLKKHQTRRLSRYRTLRAHP